MVSNAVDIRKQKKNVKDLFQLILPDIRKSNAVWKVPGLRLFVSLVRATCR